MRWTLMDILEPRVTAVVDEMIPEQHELTISPVPPADWPFDNPYELWLTVSVGDERFVLGLVDPEVPEDTYEVLARVRSSLNNWIAESGFGWAESR